MEYNQRKHDRIQYNQLDLCLWPRNQAIHTYKTINMGKKRHSLLINDWRDYNLYALVLRVPSNGSFPLNSRCLKWLKNDFDRFGYATQFFLFFPIGGEPLFKAWDDRNGWAYHGWGGDKILKGRISSSSWFLNHRDETPRRSASRILSKLLFFPWKLDHRSSNEANRWR